MSKKFKLVPSELPPRPGRPVSTFYSDVVRVFEKDDPKVVEVVSPEIKSSSLSIGLRKAIKVLSSPVKVVVRSGKVFLTKD